MLDQLLYSLDSSMGVANISICFIVFYILQVLDSITSSVDVLTEERGVAGDYFAQSCDGKGMYHTVPKPDSSEVSWI